MWRSKAQRNCLLLCRRGVDGRWSDVQVARERLLCQSGSNKERCCCLCLPEAHSVIAELVPELPGKVHMSKQRE